MKITLDDLKHAFKSHIRRCVPPSRAACPPAESIFSVFQDSAPPADKEKIIDHVTGCCYCLQEFELFLEVHRQQEKAIGDITGYFKMKGNRSAITGNKRGVARIRLIPRFKASPLWRWAAVSIFAVSLTILFLVGIRSFFRTPEVGERGRLPGQIRLVFPVRGKETGMPLVFRWEGTPRTEYYLLEIFDRSLLPLWKSPRIQELHYRFPQESADVIKPNEVYFWTVTAWLIDGTKRESPLEEFTIRE